MQPISFSMVRVVTNRRVARTLTNVNLHVSSIANTSTLRGTHVLLKRKLNPRIKGTNIRRITNSSRQDLSTITSNRSNHIRLKNISLLSNRRVNRVNLGNKRVHKPANRGLQILIRYRRVLARLIRNNNRKPTRATRSSSRRTFITTQFYYRSSNPLCIELLNTS